MRRSFVFLFAAFVFAAALTLSPPFVARTQGNLQEKCDECMQKVQAKFEKCLAKYGEVDPYCYDEYNEGVVHCYAHWCEQ